MTITKTLKNLIKNADLTGAPVSLGYKNSNSHKSVLGGLVTILSRLGILAFFLALVRDIYYQEKIVTIKSVHKDANRDNQT